MADIDTDHETASGVIDPMGGANQTRVRAYNERLVLSLVRRHGALSKADIARRTGLSAQTVSVIMRALEKDGLLTRGNPQRGRVGQPSIPMSLNPDGVLSLGLKVGRRSADLILMDFTGRVRFQLHEAYRYPTPAGVLTFVEAGVATVLASLGAERSRIAGLGVALPFELWNWVEEVGAPMADMDAWRHADIAALLAERLPFPVLSDPDRDVYERYSLTKKLVMMQQSGTVLIDQKGIIRYMKRFTNPQAWLGSREMTHVLEAVATLNA